MKHKLTTVVASVAAVAIAGVGVAVSTGVAFAAYSGLGTGGAPQWETGNTVFTAAPGYPNLDPLSKGGLQFRDSSGMIITGGNNLSHIADYISTLGYASRTGSDSANVIFARPDHTKTTAAWSTSSAAGSAFFPVTGVSALNALGSTVAVASLGSTEGNLTNFLAVSSNDAYQDYSHVVQVRVKDSGYSGATSGLNSATAYWSADIEYNNTGSALADGLADGEWRQVFPAVSMTTVTVGTPTADGLTSSAGYSGDTTTFTATVNNSATGTIQFKVAGVDFGAPVAISAGSATSGSYTLPSVSGANSTTKAITAVYAPTAFSTFNAATSSALTVTVNAPAAHATKVTAITVVSSNGADTGTNVTQPATATLSTDVADTDNSNAAVTTGSLHFFDGATDLGAATYTGGHWTLAASSNSLTASGAPGTSHSITADYTGPSSLPATFNASSSSSSGSAGATTVYVITGQVGTPGSSYVQTEIAAGTITITAPYASSGAALDLGSMTLDPTEGYQSNGILGDIVIGDTRAGNLAYDVFAESSDLTQIVGSAGPTGTYDTIDARNVGLTAGALSVSGTNNALGTPVFSDAAAAAFVNPGATISSGNVGIGASGGAKVLHMGQGLGILTLHYDVTINAPVLTTSGTYQGTVTFTAFSA